MPIETVIDVRRQLVHHRLSYPLGVADIAEAIRGQLALPGFSADMAILWEVMPGATRDLFGNAALSLRRVTEELGDDRGTSRTAMVAESDPDYGMARVMQAYLSNHTREVRVFRDREEALAWLARGSGS